jgi:hypothetical protein
MTYLPANRTLTAGRHALPSHTKGISYKYDRRKWTDISVTRDSAHYQGQCHPVRSGGPDHVRWANHSPHCPQERSEAGPFIVGVRPRGMPCNHKENDTSAGCFDPASDSSTVIKVSNIPHPFQGSLCSIMESQVIVQIKHSMAWERRLCSLEDIEIPMES